MRKKFAIPMLQRPTAWSPEGDYTQRAAREIAALIRNNATDDTLLAVNHAGAVPYYSKVSTIDMTGLSDLHIAHIESRGMHQKYDAAYVLSRRPHFILFNTHQQPTVDGIVPDHWAGETAVYRHPDFSSGYVMVPRIWTVMWHAQPNNFLVLYRRTDMELESLTPSSGLEPTR